MYLYTFLAGLFSGVLIHRYRWKLGVLLLKGAINAKVGIVNYCRRKEDIIIPTAVDGVEEHIFNNGNKNNSSGHDDYRKMYLIGDDIYAFKDDKDKYLNFSDEFLCCFLKSYDDGEELLDVSSQMKKSIFYIKTNPSLRSKFTVKMFLDVCQFEEHYELELVWIDKELNEKTRQITSKDKELDIYYLFNE